MKHKPLDKTGIWLAIVCALHCLFVPVLLPTLSLMGLSFLGWEALERSMLMASVVVGGIAIGIGTRHHKSILPALTLAVGAVLYYNKDTFGHTWEPAFVVAGALFLVTAHVLNLHLCRLRRAKACDVVDSTMATSAVAKADTSRAL